MPAGIGKELFKKRKALKLRQYQVALILGVSKSVYCQWEKGNTQPLRDYTEQIVTFLATE